MKALLVSDLHYELRQFDWLHAVASEFDVVVIAGDHLDIVSTVPLQAQLVVILNHLKRLNQETRVLTSSGNHDLDGLNAAGEKTARWMQNVRRAGILADGDRLEGEDALVSICPWWDGPAAREEVAAQLAKDAERKSSRWIWIYHAPPPASPTSWTGKQHYGDEALAEWIERYKPDMVLCGHIHQSPFRRDGSWVDRIGPTWIFNAGKQIGPVPTHIVFDSESASATWYSLEGAETVDLRAAPGVAEPVELTAQ